MADKNTAAEVAAPAPKAKLNLKAVMANRMAAVQSYGNMTPKMERGFERFAANINAGKA